MLDTAEFLRSHKLKVTPQRLAIFHTLSNTCEHPSAETIYNSLRETHPTMSLATVYKTLDTFVKASLVRQLNVGEDSFRYDATTTPHPHIICTSCRCVFDLHNYDISSLRDEVRNATQFKLSHEQFYFYGECPECQSTSAQVM